MTDNQNQQAATSSETQWTATRYSLRSSRTFNELIAHFEEVVPKYPTADLHVLFARSAPWDEIVHFAENYSPLGLLVYWKDEITTIMSFAGNTAKCAIYFIGNFPVAERMYRIEPRVMNYAPLRMTITENAAGEVHLTTDRPGSEFASFNNATISQVGAGVDRKVGALIGKLGLDVPEALRTPSA
jgi:Domain of unknown function DUF302